MKNINKFDYIIELKKCVVEVWQSDRLSSDRQHLSCDVCLEVRGEIIRTALFYIVY